MTFLVRFLDSILNPLDEGRIAEFDPKELKAVTLFDDSSLLRVLPVQKY